MRYHEFGCTIEEDWKKSLAAASIGTALAFNPSSFTDQIRPPTEKKIVQKKPQNKQEELRDLMIEKAKKAGIAGNELKHLIAQVAHETLNFKKMEEVGTTTYFNKKYDIKHNPKKAKILGNTQEGDGEKYKGRGYIQLTGRYNYKRAGQALGIPLESNPSLAADPSVAADIAIWYWKHRVQPKVTGFDDKHIYDVTKKINPNMRGMQSRKAHYSATDINENKKYIT